MSDERHTPEAIVNLAEALYTIDALQGHDPQLAEQTLVEQAALLGQLHAATIGRYEEYRQIRLELGQAPHLPTRTF